MPPHPSEDINSLLLDGIGNFFSEIDTQTPHHRLHGNILPQKACCQSLQNLMKCPPLAWLAVLWHNMQTMLA